MDDTQKKAKSQIQKLLKLFLQNQGVVKLILIIDLLN